MLRREFLFLAAAALVSEAVAEQVAIRGRLVQIPGQPPALDTEQHGTIELDGDESTVAVLNDQRLTGADLEVVGRFVGPRRFLVGPIHTKAMFVRKNEKRYLITYWCETCAIRVYRPGLCMCCREEMTLDLQEHRDQ
ncbi:MAG: hypothetical protein RMK57_05755 [Bryobacterales bacterium]|nr:hypothetical protein [Bryobacteraceae bacterium]MDW8354018.1 hypothetical protein [Bryobacterales bacterium]